VATLSKILHSLSNINHFCTALSEYDYIPASYDSQPNFGIHVGAIVLLVDTAESDANLGRMPKNTHYYLERRLGLNPKRHFVYNLKTRCSL